MANSVRRFLIARNYWGGKDEVTANWRRWSLRTTTEQIGWSLLNLNKKYDVQIWEWVSICEKKQLATIIHLGDGGGRHAKPGSTISVLTAQKIRWNSWRSQLYVNTRLSLVFSSAITSVVYLIEISWFRWWFGCRSFPVELSRWNRIDLSSNNYPALMESLMIVQLWTIIIRCVVCCYRCRSFEFIFGKQHFCVVLARIHKV